MRYTEKTNKVSNHKNSNNNLSLLPHQLKPLEYLIARCPKQHGIVLNHYLGTGKTFIGLSFFNNYPKHKKVIIAPESVTNVWLSEAKKFNFNFADLTVINVNDIINFKKYNEILNNAVCIVDEAHNLYDIIDFLYNNDKNNKTRDLLDFLDIFKSTKKLMLMTGTLYTSNNISQFRWLINIAAGKTIVPYDESNFLTKYIKVFTVDKVYLQAIVPFLKLNPGNILPDDIIRNLNKYIYGSKSVAEIIFSLADTNIFKSLASIFGSNKFKNLADNYRSLSVLPKNNPENYYTVLFTNFTKRLAIGGGILTQRSLIIEYLMIEVITHLLKYIFSYLKEYYSTRYLYSRLDFDKLKKDNVDKYISYFDYRYLNDQNYPSTKEFVKRVNYTNSQLILLIKLMTLPENLTMKEYVLLDIYKTEEEAEVFKNLDKDFNKSDALKNKGRIIGNLYDNPLKFREILDIYKKSKFQKSVVYSNFYEKGILLFSKYLKIAGIDHTILEKNIQDSLKIKIIQDFNDDKISLLLLHPSFYEGLSLSGCRFLHILEPIISNKQREQLYARVVRFKSHFNLPKDEQNVTFYQWGCTLLNDINKGIHLKEYAKQFFISKDNSKTVNDILDAFKSTFSPDDKIISLYNVYTNSQKNFNNVISHLNIDNSKEPLSCCIWTPNNSCEKLPRC